MSDDSDLDDLPVVVGCGPLTSKDAQDALTNGQSLANRFALAKLISGAGLFLQGQSLTTQQTPFLTIPTPEPAHV